MSFTLQPEIFFFQEAFVNALKRNNLKLEDSLSFEKVKNNLSLRDLAKLNALSEFMIDTVGLDYTITGASFGVHWNACGCPQVALAVKNINEMIATDSIMIEIRDDLMNNQMRGTEFDIEPFQVTPFGDKKLAVIFSNGALSDPRKIEEITRQLVAKTVKGLCVYQDYGSVIGSPRGRRYVNQLFN